MLQMQLLAREASGEETAVLLVFVLWTFLSFLWPRLNPNWRREETIRQVVALSVLFFGFMVQRFWVWGLLWNVMNYGAGRWFEKLWWGNIVIDVLIAVGAVCVIREFSPTEMANRRSLTAIVIMLVFEATTHAALLWQ